ncbi:MAG TPA: hypothetical protein VGX23_16970 [Actinocrinis sp.]|nr:hypothetical protein [Actinocrinis sp.]
MRSVLHAAVAERAGVLDRARHLIAGQAPATAVLDAVQQAGEQLRHAPAVEAELLEHAAGLPQDDPQVAVRLAVGRARALAGLGPGLAFSPVNTDALSRVGFKDRPQASGLVQTVRQLGGTLGVAVIGALILGREPPAPVLRRGRPGRLRPSFSPVASTDRLTRRIHRLRAVLWPAGRSAGGRSGPRLDVCRSAGTGRGGREAWQ